MDYGKKGKAFICLYFITNNMVDLSKFTVGDFDKGAGKLKQLLWYLINALIVRASWNPFMGIKIWLLRLFGAKIGKGLVIKNNVCIKFPWKLSIGDNCWLGENCWIDNLDYVTIGNNVCISQGALLITGNHDYTFLSFPYRNAPIIVEDGVWVGAKAIVAPGVTVAKNSILSLGTVITKSTEVNGIYKGNPAVWVKGRVINRK